MPLLTILLTAALAVAVIHDIRFQKIPNWLTLGTFVLGAVYHTYLQGLSGVLFSLTGAAVGTGLLIIPYLMGGTGAGDAKLLGAVGAVLGAKGVLMAFLLTALIGGIYALGILAWQGALWSSLRRYSGMLREFLFTSRFSYIPPPARETSLRLRYGIPIALGTLLSVFMRDDILRLMNVN